MTPFTGPNEIHLHCHHVNPQVSRKNGRVDQLKCTVLSEIVMAVVWLLFLCIHSPHAGLVFIIAKKVLVDPLKL